MAYTGNKLRVRVVYDLETTGLDKARVDHPVEIGVIIDVVDDASNTSVVSPESYAWHIRLPDDFVPQYTQTDTGDPVADEIAKQTWYTDIGTSMDVATHIHNIPLQDMVRAVETWQSTAEKLLTLVQLAILRAVSFMQGSRADLDGNIEALRPSEAGVGVTVYTYNGARFDNKFLRRMFDGDGSAENRVLLPKEWEFEDLFERISQHKPRHRSKKLIDVYETVCKYKYNDRPVEHSAFGDALRTYRLMVDLPEYEESLA